MREVELVVKIPEGLYNNIIERYNTFPAEWKKWGLQAIRKGTVIPKGHGKLKDTDAICKNIISALGIRDENYLLEAEKAVYKKIKNASTIIEADRSEES